MYKRQNEYSFTLLFLRYAKLPDLTMVKVTPFSLHLLACIILTTDPIDLVVAYEKSANVDEFTINNHRTRMRQNYVVHKAMKDDLSDNKDGSSIAYASESLESNEIPEELPALIVDYANMIRNDIILLDNSVQTRTRKRGNIKTENHHEIRDVPCSCEEDDKKLIFLGEDYVPRTLETRQCDERLCPFPYGCRIREHNITVLRRKKYSDEMSHEDLPEDLKRRWVAVKKHVIVGCTCAKATWTVTNDRQDSNIFKE